MAKTLNKWVGLGSLGRDAELSYTTNGKAVLKFSIATEHRFKQGEEWKGVTEWHNIVFWGGENLAQYLTKGTKVTVTGRYSNRSYDDKSGQKKYVYEVVADDIILCGGGKQSSSASNDAYDDGDTPF